MGGLNYPQAMNTAFQQYGQYVPENVRQALSSGFANPSNTTVRPYGDNRYAFNIPYQMQTQFSGAQPMGQYAGKYGAQEEMLRQLMQRFGQGGGEYNY
jgi:hypothetical protein